MKTKYALLIGILLLLQDTISHAQVERVNEIENLYQKNAYHECITILEKALADGLTLRNEKHRFQMLLGNCYVQVGQVGLAELAYKRLLNEPQIDPEVKAIAMLNLANLKTVRSRNEDPTEWVTRFYPSSLARIYSFKERSVDTVAINYLNKGLMSLLTPRISKINVSELLLSFVIPLGDDDQHLNQLLDLSKATISEEWRYFAFLNMANIHASRLTTFKYSSPVESHSASALEFYQKALQLAMKNYGKESRLVANTYVNIGSFYDFAHRIYWGAADAALTRTDVFEDVKNKLMLTADEASLKALQNYQLAIVTSLKDFKDTIFYKIPIEYTLSNKTIQKDLVSFNEFRDAYLLKVNFLNEITFHYYHDTWKWDFNVENFRIRSSGLMDMEDGFDYTLSGYAYNSFSYYDKFLETYSQSLRLEQDRIGLAQVTYKDRVMAVDAALNFQDNDTGAVKGVSKTGSKNRGVIRVKSTVKRSPVLDAFAFAEKTKAQLLLKEVNQASTSMETETSSPIPPIPHINELQSKLDASTAVISYLISPYNFYIFIITYEGLEVRYRGKLNSAEINKHIKALRNGMLYKIDEMYAESAWELGKVLLPKLDKEITKLIIIPDGMLNTLPFEVLFEDKIKKDEISDVKNYPFWLKKYEISYAFSATFYLNNISKFIHRQEPSFLGYAPVFADEDRKGEISETNRGVLRTFDEYDTLQTRGILNGRYIAPIPNTELEVEYLQKLFGDKGLKSKIVTHSRATESNFKAEGFSDYSVIHFATHGFVNSEEPEFSGVLFMGDTTSGEDGILYSREILDLKLNADLVTLSACETGLGQVIVGEGVLGLSRSFIISGASHLLVSYWKVSDSSTSELMKAFYTEALNNNANYSAALRKAKLMLIDSGEYAQPYYWSPFVLIKS